MGHGLGAPLTPSAPCEGRGPDDCHRHMLRVLRHCGPPSIKKKSFLNLLEYYNIGLHVTL